MSQYGKITGKSFLLSIVKFSISSWINLILSVLAVVITTRIFTPDTLGMINLFNVSSMLLMSFISIGLDTSYITFFNEPPDGFDKSRLLFICFAIPAFFLTLTGIAVSCFFYQKVSMLLFQNISRMLTVLLFVNVLSLLVIRFLTIYYRMNNNPRMFSVMSILLQFFSKFFVLAAACFQPSYDVVIAFNTVGVFGLALVMAFLQTLRGRFHEIKQIVINYIDGIYQCWCKSTKKIIIFAIYSWPVPIFIYLNSFFSQMIIAQKMSAYDLGIYGSTNIFVGVLGTLSAGFGSYWSGFMFANYKTEQKKIISVHTYMQMFLLLLMGMMILFKDVIYLMIGSNYHGSKPFFAVVLVFSLLGLLTETTAYGISFARKAYITVFTYLLGGIVNIVGCFYLIPLIGLSGAAFASMGAAIVLFLIQTVNGQRYYKSIENCWKTAYAVMAMIIMATMNFFFWDQLWAPLTVMVIWGISAWLYSTELRQALGFILKSKSLT